MPPARRPRSKPTEPDPFPSSGLAELGLTEGDTVRFRRRDTERWKEGRVVRREADGSLGISDDKGAHRSIIVEGVEVKRRGPRGGVMWEPVASVAAREEQMKLL